MRADLDRQDGQASVELVAVLPCVLLVAAIGWQLVQVGHTAWLAANAARSAARADVVGRDPRTAARRALPQALERGLEVEQRRAGGVEVAVRMPLLLRAWQAPLRMTAVSSLGARPGGARPAAARPAGTGPPGRRPPGARP